MRTTRLARHSPGLASANCTCSFLKLREMHRVFTFCKSSQSGYCRITFRCIIDTHCTEGTGKYTVHQCTPLIQSKESKKGRTVLKKTENTAKFCKGAEACAIFAATLSSMLNIIKAGRSWHFLFSYGFHGFFTPLVVSISLMKDDSIHFGRAQLTQRLRGAVVPWQDSKMQ